MPMWNQLPEWGAAQTEGIVMYVTCLIWAMYVIYQVGKDKNVEMEQIIHLADMTLGRGPRPPGYNA